MELARAIPPHARALHFFLCAHALSDVAGTRPGRAVAGDHRGYRQAPVYHHRIHGTGAFECARRDLNRGGSPAHGPTLADASQCGLPYRPPRRLALLVAGEERHHRAAALCPDPGRPPRPSPVVAFSTAQIKTGAAEAVPAITTQLLRQATFTVCLSATRILGSVTVRIPSFSSAWMLSPSTSTGRATVLKSLP